MAHRTDHELLAEFLETGSESSFSALVARHVNLVYSAALRHTNNPHHAEEITQTVFILLARKAGSISSKAVLSGWLYQAARLTAANYRRDNQRRQQREQQAFMESALNVPADEPWKLIAPILDEAMGALGITDRDAVLLRYFENKPLAEVGAALGVSEAAAEKRVSRALERLRVLLTRQGVALGAPAIAGVITAKAVQAAPPALAATIPAAALTATSLTSATLAMTTLQKIAAMAVLAAAIGAGIYAAKQAGDAHREVRELQAKEAQLVEQIRQLQSTLNDATNRLTGLMAENSELKSGKDKMEVLKLRGEVSAMRTQLASSQNRNLETTNGAPELAESTPAQIHIKAKFIEIPRQGFVMPSAFAGKNDNNTSAANGILGPAQLRVICKALEQREGVKVAESSVVTLSGRQCQIRTGDQTAPGQPAASEAIVDLIPTLSADGYTIKLKATVSAPEALNGEVNLYDHQTVLFSATEKTKPDSQLIVLLTATLVNPVGNVVHADDELPFAQNGAPPQN